MAALVVGGDTFPEGRFRTGLQLHWRGFSFSSALSRGAGETVLMVTEGLTLIFLTSRFVSLVTRWCSGWKH